MSYTWERLLTRKKEALPLTWCGVSTEHSGERSSLPFNTVHTSLHWKLLEVYSKRHLYNFTVALFKNILVYIQTINYIFKTNQFQIEPQKESFFFIEDASHWIARCWCFKLYEKQTIAVWYLVQQKGNVVLWHQVHCGLSSIKAKIDKMGPFISIRGFGFHGCHGGLYQREVFDDWHLKFFLHQYTPEAHSLCMSYIMRPHLYIHGPRWHSKCQSIVRPRFDLWYHKLKSNASWAEVVQVSHRV